MGGAEIEPGPPSASAGHDTHRGPSWATTGACAARACTVFETDAVDDRDAHLSDLLRSPYYWAFAATIEGGVVGGLTGYTLSKARTNARELFIYDLPFYRAIGMTATPTTTFAFGFPE